MSEKINLKDTRKGFVTLAKKVLDLAGADLRNNPYDSVEACINTYAIELYSGMVGSDAKTVREVLEKCRQIGLAKAKKQKRSKDEPQTEEEA